MDTHGYLAYYITKTLTFANLTLTYSISCTK